MWRYRPPDSAWLSLPTAMRYGNMMWHDGVCSAPWIETGAAHAPGKEWNERKLKENASVLTLPSFSLSSLASPYETICYVLPTLGAAKVELLLCSKDYTEKDTFSSHGKFWLGNNANFDHGIAAQKPDAIILHCQAHSLCYVLHYILPSPFHCGNL